MDYAVISASSHRAGSPGVNADAATPSPYQPPAIAAMRATPATAGASAADTPVIASASTLTAETPAAAATHPNAATHATIANPTTAAARAPLGQIPAAGSHAPLAASGDSVANRPPSHDAQAQEQRLSAALDRFIIPSDAQPWHEPVAHELLGAALGRKWQDAKVRHTIIRA